MEREYKHHFETELAARRYMRDLDLCKVKYSYYHESVCSYYVTIIADENGKQN